MEKLTQKELKEILHYDPENGVFTWKKQKANRLRVGAIAGYKNKYGYIVIMINGKNYKAHRLAWLYEKGYLPENDLDHIDRTRYNNQILNLREVSRQCNNRNTDNPKDNTSGVKGVHWFKATKKWQVQITINQKTKHLGYFKSKDNAVCARLAGEQCLNWQGCDSNSPAYNYVKKMLGGHNGFNS